MTRAAWWVSGIGALAIGCAAPSRTLESDDPIESTQAHTSTAPASDQAGAKAGAADGLFIGGKPIETVRIEEITAAAATAGWQPPSDLPPGMHVMRRTDGGRESLSFVLDRAGARLNLQIVRPIPGETLRDGTSILSAKATHDAFHGMGKPAKLAGESVIVVVDGAIGVKGAAPKDMQALLDALTQR